MAIVPHPIGAWHRGVFVVAPPASTGEALSRCGKLKANKWLTPRRYSRHGEVHLESKKEKKPPFTPGVYSFASIGAAVFESLRTTVESTLTEKEAGNQFREGEKTRPQPREFEVIRSRRESACTVPKIFYGAEEPLLETLFQVTKLHFFFNLCRNVASLFQVSLLNKPTDPTRPYPWFG